MKKEKIKSVISLIIISLALILFLAVKYMTDHFGNMFTEVVYYLFNGVESTGGNTFINGVKSCIIPFIILFCYLSLPVIGFIKHKVVFSLKIRKKTINVTLPFKHKIIYALVILALSLGYCYKKCDLSNYLAGFVQETTIYEDYYVDGRELDLVFPKEKHNLIVIFAESMESSLITEVNGGFWDYSVIPELEELALDNTNFSHNSKIGGAYSTNGTTWTVSGLVAQTAGVSMSVFAQNNNNNNYTKDTFMTGAYSLGDVLKENGYNLEIMFGSDASFGGRRQYFTNHGNYQIFDYTYAHNNKLVTDYIWWGFEDYKLFDFAKVELEKLANKDEPFNLMLLTADTHFTDGCIDCVREEYKINKYETQYENVYNASSREIGEFVNWIKKQDFYENTTIVILGDHLSMQPNFFGSHNQNNESRNIYNAFINSSVDTSYDKNRVFSSLDMYPTILASIGVDIPGDRLGLGTNLYSGKKTLFEELGRDYVNGELGKKSKYYNEHILASDYLDIIYGDLD